MPAASLEQRLADEVTRLRAEAAELQLGDLEPTPAKAIGTNFTGRPAPVVRLSTCSPAGASPPPDYRRGVRSIPAQHTPTCAGVASRTLG